MENKTKNITNEDWTRWLHYLEARFPELREREGAKTPEGDQP
jgi:hypothetical protein